MTDAPEPVPGPLYKAPPTAADIAYARTVLRDRTSDPAAIIAACDVLAWSPDYDDQMVARYDNRIARWHDVSAEIGDDVSDVAADDDRRDAVYNGARTTQTDAWDEPPPRYNAAIVIGAIGWALLIGVLVWIFAMLPGAAADAMIEADRMRVGGW